MYSHYLRVLKLLKMGIPYAEIFELDEDEINKLLGINSAIEEYVMKVSNG